MKGGIILLQDRNEHSLKEKLFDLTYEINKKNGNHYMDEASTKQGVVLRLLYHLGWNPFNINEVLPNYSLGEETFDYALQYQGSIKALIEVKKLGEDLEGNQEKLINQSYDNGVNLAVLTNGISWWFYLLLQEKLEGEEEEIQEEEEEKENNEEIEEEEEEEEEVDREEWEQGKFYAINLKEQELEDITRKFEMLLSKENILSGKALHNAQGILREKYNQLLIKDALNKAMEKILRKPHPHLIDLILETTEDICGFRPEEDMVKNHLEKYMSQLEPQNQFVPRTRFEPTVKAPVKSELQIETEVLEESITHEEAPVNINKESDRAARIKLSEFVQDELYDILSNNMLDSDVISDLQRKEYCEKELKLGFPLLKKVGGSRILKEQGPGKMFPRYRSKANYFTNEVIIDGVTYLVCNQWYEKVNRKPLKEWLFKQGLDSSAEKLD